MGQAIPAEKSRLKRLISPFVSPPTYDFWSRQIGSIHAWSRCYARVIARRPEADNTFTLRLLPNANFSGFTPGQHVNVTARIRGRRVTRSYSFSSTPDERWVEITVRHDPEGHMSHWLFEHAMQGTVLELERVFGDMTADQFCGQPLVFLAGGSGITPLMSLLREQASLGMPRPVSLVYFERHEGSFCFVEELESLARRFDGFKLHTIATRQDRSRRISAAQLDSLGVDVTNAQVVACGSGAFVEQARVCTEDAASSFHSEAFTPLARRATTDAQTFTVELTRSKRQIEVSNQQTLLTALEEQGVVVQTGCRMGVCNTCSCEKIVGHTQTPDTPEIDSNTNTSVRLCVTTAASDMSLAI